MKGLYRIEYRNSVAKELRKLSKTDLVLVIAKIKDLAQNPFPAGMAKLLNSNELYRVRQGDYRIIYQVDRGQFIVLVVKIGHRRAVYRA